MTKGAELMDLTIIEPISRSAVELRLSPLGWPVEADASESHIQPYNDASCVASHAFQAFDAVIETARKNEGLTDLGRRLAAHDWATKNLPALREKLERVRKHSTEQIDGASRKMTASFTTPAEEPQDIALLQEVRTWLRTMPENQRTEKVMQLARSGDRTALRAVLTAPTYLTGIDANLREQVRDIVAEADDPDRFARVQAIKKAVAYTERALEGVIRFIEQEGTVRGKRPGATGMAA